MLTLSEFDASSALSSEIVYSVTRFFLTFLLILSSFSLCLVKICTCYPFENFSFGNTNDSFTSEFLTLYWTCTCLADEWKMIDACV